MTRDELRGIIDGISDEQLKSILDINSSDIGKFKAENLALKGKIEELSAKEKQLSAEMQELLMSQGAAEELRGKVDELQKILDQKTLDEEKKKSEAAVLKRFEAAAENEVFVNDFTRRGIFEEFKAALLDEKNSGKADAEIFKAVVLDKDNLFVPQGGVPSVVGYSPGFGASLTDGDVREIMGLPADR